MSQPSTFGGNKKIGTSILWSTEQRFIRFIVPKIPQWVHSYHLVLASVPISLSIILCSFLAKDNSSWLWIVSALIFIQWLTDSVDGALGRYRKEGLIIWGYYMDHLLDYFFLASIVTGYMLLLPDHYKYLQFFVLVIFAGFMVNSFLTMAATNEFRISHLGIGPTEIRCVFIIINTLIYFFGKTYMGGALPYILILSFIGLIIVIYRTQKACWEKDMRNLKTPAA